MDNFRILTKHGGIKFGYLVHCVVEGNDIVSQEIIAEGIGRVRNVKQGLDGFLYVGIEGKGIYRLIAKKIGIVSI